MRLIKNKEIVQKLGLANIVRQIDHDIKKRKPNEILRKITEWKLIRPRGKGRPK